MDDPDELESIRRLISEWARIERQLEKFLEHETKQYDTALIAVGLLIVRRLGRLKS